MIESDQYFTLPHVSYRTIQSPDGSQIVTWSVRQTPLDSTGVTVDPDVSQIVTWPVRQTPLDSTGIKGDSCLEKGIQLSPPDCARLCQTGLFWSQKWQWSPERGVQWIPPDCAGLEWQNGSGVQRGGSGGFRRTVQNWSDKIVVESREGGPVDSAGLCRTGVKKWQRGGSSGFRQTVPDWTLLESKIAVEFVFNSLK